MKSEMTHLEHGLVRRIDGQDQDRQTKQDEGQQCGGDKEHPPPSAVGRKGLIECAVGSGALTHRARHLRGG